MSKATPVMRDLACLTVEALRQIGDLLPIALFWIDAAQVCTYSNQQCQTLCALLASDHPQSWLRLVHPQEREAVAKRWMQEAVADEFCLEFQLADTVLRHVECRFKACRDAKLTLLGHVAVLIDITQHNANALSSQAHHDVSRKILSNTIDGFFTSDIKGNIYSANQAFCQMLGYTLEEITQLHISDIEASESPELVQIHIRKVIETGYDRFESRHRHKDGRIIDVELSVNYDPGMTPPFVAFVRDISEHKQIETELRLQVEVINNMLEGVVLVNESSVIVYASAKFEAMFGYGAGELLNQPVSILNADTDQTPQQTAAAIIDELKRTGTWRGEIENVRKDGSHFWCQSSVTVFKHSRFGTVFVSIHSDITEQRKMLAQQEKLEMQLHQARKMQALGTLAGGIAHEFNNMLGIIIGNTQLLQDDLPISEQKYLDRIYKASTQAKDLVQKILTFNRKSSVKPVPIQLSKTLDEFIHFFSTSFPRTIQIHRDICAEPICILANADEVHQTLINIVSNAIYAMQGRGNLYITLRTITISGQDLSLNLKRGHYAVLSIRDDGMGMNAEVKERACEPFFTTKAAGQGTGMGLSLVYGIMRSYNGTIHIDSELGKGSTFHLYFPLLAHEAMQ